jgi:hypothetical protein
MNLRPTLPLQILNKPLDVRTFLADEKVLQVLEMKGRKGNLVI